MKSKMSAKEAVLALYKTAASGMAKKALDFDSLKSGFQNLNPGARAAILGGLGGAGLGIASHVLTPKDEDEDTRGRLLRNILTGAALGGLAGYGGKTFYDAMKNNGFGGGEEPEPGWYQRNAPELGYSDVAILGGMGTGAVAGGAYLNSRRINKGLARLGADSSAAENSIRNMFSPRGWNEKAIQGSEGLTAARQAYRRATEVGIGNKLKQLIPNWKRLPGKWRQLGIDARLAQKGLDNALLQALEDAATHGKPANFVSPILRSKIKNPRLIMKAMQAKNLPKGKLGLIAAALLLGGAGYKGYQLAHN